MSYPVLLPPAGSLDKMFLETRSWISRKAVSVEHFPILAHLDVVIFPQTHPVSG